MMDRLQLRGESEACHRPGGGASQVLLLSLLLSSSGQTNDEAAAALITRVKLANLFQFTDNSSAAATQGDSSASRSM